MFDLNALAKIKEEANLISGQWNGDEPGLAEENAHIAEDIIKKVEELEELITSL